MTQNNESFYKKYIKYKTKYIKLQTHIKRTQKGGTIICGKCNSLECLKEVDCLFYSISSLPDESIFINETLYGDETKESKESELIVIPGFSTSSYERNYSTLFEYYDTKLNINNFTKVHLIKFRDDAEISIKKLHDSFFGPGNEIKDINLENKLYEKCAQIIKKKLDLNNKYTILGKSAGGGVSLCLSQLIPSNVSKLYLFAPGVKYLANYFHTLELPQDKIYVGWNLDDTKVKMEQIWPKLKPLMPGVEVNQYYKNIYNQVDTQHEINTEFIKLINSNSN
jgi:hypothetical protein